MSEQTKAWAVVVLAVMLAGCSAQTQPAAQPQSARNGGLVEVAWNHWTHVARFKDPETGVTCYVAAYGPTYTNPAISCVTITEDNRNE